MTEDQMSLLEDAQETPPEDTGPSLDDVVEAMAAAWREDAPLYKRLREKTGQSVTNLLLWQLLRANAAQTEVIAKVGAMTIAHQRQEQQANKIVTPDGMYPGPRPM